MNRKLKIIRMVVLILAVISVLALDVKLVRHINGKTQESYWKQNYVNQEQVLKKKKIKTEFQAVNRSLTKIQIWTNQTEEPKGNISWKVEDETGKTVLEEQKADASKTWDAKTNTILLDISETKYEAGATYFITTDFDFEDAVKIFMDTKGVMHTQQYRVEYQWLLYTGMVLVNLFIAVSMIAYWKWGWNDRLFFGIVVVIGISAVFLIAPFSRDDEFRHFVRAYDLSCGGGEGYSAKPQKDAVGNVFESEKGEAQLIKIPTEISELRLVSYEGNYNIISYHAEINTRLCLPKLLSIFEQSEIEDTVEVAETATANKGLENYWPQVIMIKLGMLLGIRSGLWYYLAGIGQVLVTSLLLWLSFRLAKQHENLITVCGLVPVITLLYASSNPDGLMIAEIVLCLAIILHMRETKMCLKSKKGILLSVLYIILVYQVYLMKMPYALLCMGFILLLGKENFSWLPWEKIRKYKVQIVMAVAAFGIIAVVYLIVIRKGDIFLSVIYQFLPQPYMEYILTHFKEFMIMYLQKGRGLIKETFLSLRSSYYISYGVMACLILVFSRKRFSVIYKCYHVFLYLCMLGMIVLVGYTLTPPDYGQIWGITYRYMLPALPILGLALPFGNEKTEYYVNQIYPLILIPMIFASSLAWLGM